MQKDTSSVTPPWTVVISKHVSIRYGYRDAHVEVGLSMVGLTKWLRFEAEDLTSAEHAFTEAKKWRDLPADVRERSGA